MTTQSIATTIFGMIRFPPGCSGSDCAVSLAPPWARNATGAATTAGTAGGQATLFAAARAGWAAGHADVIAPARSLAMATMRAALSGEAEVGSSAEARPGARSPTMSLGPSRRMNKSCGSTVQHGRRFSVRLAIHAQGPGGQVAQPRHGGLRGGQQAQVDLLLQPGMVA